MSLSVVAGWLIASPSLHIFLRFWGARGLLCLFRDAVCCAKNGCTCKRVYIERAHCKENERFFAEVVRQGKTEHRSKSPAFALVKAQNMTWTFPVVNSCRAGDKWFGSVNCPFKYC